MLEYCCAVLKDMLDQTPDKKFPVWQSHDYFTQLLEGLAYLHSRGELLTCPVFQLNILNKQQTHFQASFTKILSRATCCWTRPGC